jgi:hypothetical protein
MTVTLGNWGVPWSFPTEAKIGILIAIGLAAVFLTRRNPSRHPPEAHWPVRASALIWFAVVYGLGVLALSWLLAFDLLKDRILSPIYAPLALWLLIWGWNRVAALSPARWRRVAGTVLVFLVVVWVGRSAVTTSRMVDHEHNYGQDYSKDRWKKSMGIRYLRNRPPERLLYSNQPYPVYLYTRLTTIESPREHHFDARQTKTNDLAEFTEVVTREKEVLLIWFEERPNDYHYGLDELRPHFDLVRITDFEDGNLYRVTPKTPVSP